MLVITEHVITRFKEKLNEFRFLNREVLCNRIKYEYEKGNKINIGIDKDFLVQLKSFPEFVFACVTDEENVILKTVLTMDHAVANSQIFIRKR